MKREIVILAALACLLAGCQPDTVWSPDSKQIAVEAKGLLFTFDVATHRFQQRTAVGPTKALNASWAPDGKRLVYYRAVVKNGEITALDLMALDLPTGRVSVLIPKLAGPQDVPPQAGGENGAIQIKLNGRLEAAQELLSVAWSPDRSHLVYVAYSGQDPTLWIANSDGSGAHALLPKGQNAMRPSWSPDGAHIAFLRLPAPPAEPKPGEGPGEVPPTLEVISADGSGGQALWAPDRKDRLAALGPEPQWTADSKSLLIFTDVPKAIPPDAPKQDGAPPAGPAGSSDQCQIWTVPLDGEPSKLGDVPGPSPFVSLAAGRLAFFYQQKPGEENPFLWLLPPPYSEPRKIIEITPAMFGQKPDQRGNVDSVPVPALAPDGKWVALSFVPDKGTARLALFPTAGGQPQVFPIPVPAPPPAPAAGAKGKAAGGKGKATGAKSKGRGTKR